MILSYAQGVAIFSRKTRKCMSWLVQTWLFGVLLVLSSAVHSSGKESNVFAADGSGRQDVSSHFWIDKAGDAKIDRVSSSSMDTQFQRMTGEQMFRLKPNERLWIRLDFAPALALRREHQILWIPLPLLDSVKLFQRVEGGAWKVEEAGDRVAVVAWPEPGRYPRFHLDDARGQSSVYLQVMSGTPVSIPIYIGAESRAQGFDRTGFLGLGLVVGLLMSLVLYCMVTAYIYKDPLYVSYGLYMLVMVLAVAAYTGLAGYLLWNDSPFWADAAQGVLAILSVAGALYFIEVLLGGKHFARRNAAALVGLAIAGVPLALAYLFVPRSIGVVLLAVYVLSGAAVGLNLAIRSWSNGDEVGKWVCVAYVPLALAVLMAIARAFGLIAASWLVQYGVVVALLIEAPMMMVALNIRSRDQHEISTREHAMSTHDALTGFLKEHLFDYRVDQAVKRYQERGENAAVVLVSMVNHDSIKRAFGSNVAEQSIVRAVIKLRKVLGNSDSLSRVGDSGFGLLLEQSVSRTRITELAARLVAEGLMPLPGLVPSVTLQFHIAAVCLKELPREGVAQIKGELLRLLSDMSPRTRRPIRFLEEATINGADAALRAVAQVNGNGDPRKLLQPPAPIRGDITSSSGPDSLAAAEDSATTPEDTAPMQLVRS